MGARRPIDGRRVTAPKIGAAPLTRVRAFFRSSPIHRLFNAALDLDKATLSQRNWPSSLSSRLRSCRSGHERRRQCRQDQN
jgi:hypothetical protein